MRKSLLANYSVIHAPREIDPLLRELQRAGWDITVHIGWSGASAERTTRDLQRDGFNVIAAPPTLAYASEPTSGQGTTSSSTPRRLLRRLAPRWTKLLWHTAREFLDVRECRRQARKLFEQIRPSLFLSNNFHSCGRLDNALLDEAKHREILSACVLVSPLVSKYIARPGRLNQYRAGMTGETVNVRHYGLASELTARAIPKWVVSEKEVSLFMWPLSRMFASYLAGLLPRDVWQTPHEDFDVVFAPNRFSQELLSKSAYPMEKVHVFGPPRLDEALELIRDPIRRQHLYRRLDLPPDTAYILWNVEPSWEHSYCSEEQHWARVREVARILESTGQPVVVSLHPLCDPARYMFLSSTHGFKIPIDDGIHRLYPLAAFVVTFPCSTNQYASIFGKRLLMYDWFGASTSPTRSELYVLENMRVATNMSELERIVLEETRNLTKGERTISNPLLPRPASIRIASKLEELWSGKVGVPSTHATAKV